MQSSPRRVRRLSIVAMSAALVLAACGSDDAASTEAADDTTAPTESVETESDTGSDAESGADAETPTTETDTPATDEAPDADEAGTRTVVDRQGEVEVPVPAERIVATDNRVVRLLDDWGIELVAAPLDVFPGEISYADDDAVANLGAHSEPDLEALIASDPDLVLNGFRFSTFYDQIKELVPDAAVVNTDLDPDATDLAGELRWITTLAGESVGHADEAAALIAEFDAAIEQAIAAYDPDETVMGLLTSGGDISYVAPVTGRSVGPVFSIVGLTPALDQEADDVSHGDDISVEAIAAANPDWMIVLDRDAAITADGDEFSSAAELLSGSEALANVTAVVEGNIIYLPSNFYLTEDILAYTELFNSMAAAMGAAS